MTVEVRPRTSWEAMDLGFVMARRWFMPLWILWWLGALPAYLITLWFFADTPWAVMLILWWLKPLYEPPLVFWVSRALFDEPLPLRAVLPHWWRSVAPRLFANLTWNRIDLNRSFHMPVAVLEGLHGKERKQRLRILARRKQGGSWLTIVGYHIETVLMISLLIFLMMLIPEELRWLEWEDLFAGEGRLEYTIQQLGYLLAMSLFAPFYVAGGFALYLTRRTELEAWDLELRFRRIAERTREQGRVAIALLLIGAGWLSPQTSVALEISRKEASETIETVLAEGDFGKEEEVGYWHYIEREQEREVDPSRLEWLLDLIGGFFKGIAAVGETILWIAVGVGIGLLIYWIYRNREWLGGLTGLRTRRRRPPPTEIFGLAVTPESLPDDIAGEALRLLAAGDPRAALSLLYRGALSRFIHRDQLEIRDSSTEGECLQLVEQSAAANEASLFARLTQAWIHLAYGHHQPQSEAIRQLCRDWRNIYQDMPEVGDAG
jgi:hypothetical protein